MGEVGWAGCACVRPGNGATSERRCLHEGFVGKTSKAGIRLGWL